MASLPDLTPALLQMKEKIPPKVRILASERLRNHFMFDHPTGNLSAARKTGDYIVIALNDRLMDSAEMLESLRRQIAFDPKIIPIVSASAENRHFAVFKVTDGSEKSPVPPLQTISAADFARIGSPVPDNDPFFDIRYLHNGRNHVFLVRITKVPDFDVDLMAELESSDGEKNAFADPFGWGLYPAYSCPVGAVFIVEKPGPPAKGIQVFCAERKASRFKR